MTTENQTTNPKAPALNAYQVRKREGAKAVWTKIGAAWPNRDGQGFNIRYEMLPTEYDVVLRVSQPKA